MAVQEQTPLREYTANGVTTSFALGFDCEETNHLIVTIDDVEVLPTDWYLSGSNVIFWNAPGNGKLIKLQRNTPFNRLADYQSYNNSFRPPAINKDFDRIWWKLQELGVADWILGNRIDALKNYVDRKDDELKAYLMEEIRKQGVALDQLDEYYNYLMQRLAQIAVDKGWDASFVVYHGVSQKKLNDGLESIADMLAIVNPQDGMRVYVKSYREGSQKGGGWFVYDSSKSTVNDGGVVINGWVRLVDDANTVYPEWFGANPDDANDDHSAIMAAINYLCPVAYQGTWQATTARSAGTVVFGTGEYLISDQILCPPYIKLQGSGSRWYFAGDQKNFTNIIANFSDVNKFAIQSASYVVATGQLVANNVNVTGTQGFDGRVITGSHGIRIYDMNIVAAKQQLGGIRLVCSPKSAVERVFIAGFDIGCKVDASWSSTFNIATQHYKMGLYLGGDSNACTINGYLTGDSSKAPLSTNYWKSILQVYDSTTGLSNKYAEESTVFGLVNYWNQGCEVGTLIAEGNSVSVFNARGNMSIKTLYTERNSYCSVVGHTGNVDITDITGARDQSSFEIGSNAVFNLTNDNQTGVIGNRVISISEYGGALFAPDSFNYVINGVILRNFSNTVFVSNTVGVDTNAGSVGAPVKTIDAALNRLDIKHSRAYSATPIPNLAPKEIVILDNSAYTITQNHTIHGGLSIRGTATSGTKASLLFNRPLILNSSDLTIANINLNRGSTNFANNENGCIWIGDGRISVTTVNCNIDLGSYSFIYPYYLRAGICDVIVRGGTVTGTASNTFIQSAYENDELHLFNILLKSVTFTGGIETRADKGFAFPAANRGQVLGISL